MQKTITKASQLIIKIITILLIVIYAYLSIQSIIGTTQIDMNLNNFKEYAYFKVDNILLTLFLFSIFLAIIILIDYTVGIEKLSTTKLQYGVIIAFFAISMLWLLMIQGRPVDDQYIVQLSASEFIDGNYDSMAHGEYLYRSKHQLGIVFIFECIYRIFGSENYQAIMVLNSVLAAGVLNNLYQILTFLTKDKKVHNMYWIMTAGCIQFAFYTFFVYGTIIGLFFMTGGIYLLMKYFHVGQYRYYIGGFLALAFAIISKSNFQIFLIAIFLVMLFAAIKEFRVKEIILSFVLLLTLFSPNLIVAHYEKRSGIELGNGTPASLFIAMGLQEGDKENACGADGWYNAYNAITMNSVDYDYDAANEIGSENIKNRLEEFRKNPKTAFQFAFEKQATQWAEPTFQTFWMVTIRDNHGNLSNMAESIVSGNINTVLQKYMKVYLIFMWIGCFIYYFVKRKELDIWHLLTGIVVLGGFLFHFFWEGKALYIMPYFVMSLFAACQGILYLINWIEKKFLSQTLHSNK